MPKAIGVILPFTQVDRTDRKTAEPVRVGQV